MLKIIKKFWTPKPEKELIQSRARLVIPEGKVADIFAIGDIHGHLDLLLAAETRILAKMQQMNRPALVIYVGDFVDRGPDSRGVIDHLVRKMPSPCYRICLCGNHDDAFLTFLKDDRFDPNWLDFGGDTTLFSYGVDARHLLAADPRGQQLKDAARARVPAEHVNFLTRLPIALTIGRYLFVHAGIVPGKSLDEQSDLDLMWVREPFLSQGPGMDMTVIHGHTPSAAVQYGPSRIGIDTGAYATGKLSVLHIGPDGMSEV